jgi:serine/threonine protein kinase
MVELNVESARMQASLELSYYLNKMGGEPNQGIKSIGGEPTPSYLLEFYDAYKVADQEPLCLVLEYMGGGSLKQLIDTSYIVGEKEVAIVAYSVLHALQELHSKNVIHRDVKPGNILCKSTGEVKLADFGIASKGSIDCRTTFTGSMCYMSPERVRGEEYSANCDCWGLGLSLFFFFRGQLPFPKVKGFWNLLDILQANQFSTKIMKTCPINFSPALHEFIGLCLTQDPSKRPGATSLLQSSFILQVTLTLTLTLRLILTLILTLTLTLTLCSILPVGPSAPHHSLN